jgi:hypothetical protein
MKRLMDYLVVSVLAVLAFAILSSGCTKQGAERVAGPAPPPGPDLSGIREARWITSMEELRGVTARAAKSPLMASAIEGEASDPRLSLLRDAVIGAVGTTKGGDQVRVTLLPYQYSDDQNHARYFVLFEVNGQARVESFDLIRNRRPAPGEEGFERVNSGEHGLWMRSGTTYVQAANAGAHKAPEKFNFAKFGTCFVPLADRLLSGVHEGCHDMGNFPGCVAIGSTAAIAGAAIYCGWVAWNG